MTTLMTGVPEVLASGDIRALPGRAGRLHVTIDTATSIELSNNANMDDAQSFVAADFQTAGPYEAGIDVSSAFMRSVGGAATVRFAAY